MMPVSDWEKANRKSYAETTRSKEDGRGVRRRKKGKGRKLRVAKAKPTIDRSWDQGKEQPELNAVEMNGVFTAEQLAARLHAAPPRSQQQPQKKKAKKRTRGKAKFRQALRRKQAAG